MVTFAGRLSRLEASPTLAVAQLARELRADGVDIIDLGPGEPDFATPSVVCDAAKRAIDAGHTRYTDSNGIAELREAIAEKYNREYGSSISPSNVICGNGGKQELFNLMLALVDDGDEVIIPAPYWVSFPQQVQLVGGKPVIVELSASDGFRVHPWAIEEAVTDRTRVVILNSPSNPTGAIIEEEDLRKIAEICHARGVVLLYDETYEQFVYDGAEHASVAPWFDELSPGMVIVNSMSKTYAMTGWRIGYAIAAEVIVKALGKIQSHSTSNPASISQYAACDGLRHGDPDIERMIEAYGERRGWLVPALRQIPGFECAPPGGAFYVFPDVSSHYRDEISGSVDFTRFLLDEARVAVVPGAAFGNDAHVRMSYAIELDRLKEAVERIRAAVETRD